MKNVWIKLVGFVLILSLLVMPVYADDIIVSCTHTDVNANGVCQNPDCGVQAVARVETADTVEYMFAANTLAWKTIRMNNNETDDTYTITLLSDIPSVSLTILADNVTLDLNGFSMGYTRGDFGNIVYLDEKGNLTIMDSSAEGTGYMYNPTGPVVDFSRSPFESEAVLTIKQGTFESDAGITFWLGAGTMYVEGGTVIGDFQAGAGAITGGRFSLDPTVALTDEYEAVLEDGYYVVKKVSGGDQAFLLGDANHDGKTDSSDAVAILRHLAGYEVPGFFEDTADFNGDGYADSSDAVAILRKLAGY